MTKIYWSASSGNTKAFYSAFDFQLWLLLLDPLSFKDESIYC